MLKITARTMTKSLLIPLATLVITGAVIGGTGAQGASPGAPEDPAPPKVRPLPDAAPLEPEDFERLTFHRAAAPLAAAAKTADWPHLLGPSFNFSTPESHLLEEWPADDASLSPVWEVERGPGYAAPVISGRFLVHIFRHQEKELVECLNPENGKRYWFVETEVDHGQSFGVEDSARASPTIKGDFVYTVGVASHFQCIHLPSGEVIWKRDLQSEFKTPRGFFGKGGSPLVHGESVILNLGGEQDACVVAFDKRSGVVRWIARHSWGGSYASPVPAVLHGEERILVFAGGQSRPPHGGLLCINPANGAIDSSVPWRPDLYASVNAASPVLVHPDRVFITEAYGNGGAMIRFNPDLSATTEWTSPQFSSQFSTPIFHKAHLYGFDGQSDAGTALVCFEARTGRELWRHQDLNAGRGNLLRAGGHIYCAGEHGELFKLLLSPAGVRVLDSTRLFHAPETFTPPVLSRGLLYVVQSNPDIKAGTPPRLLCYDLRAPEDPKPEASGADR